MNRIGNYEIPSVLLPAGEVSMVSSGLITSNMFRVPDTNGQPIVTIHPDGRVELGEGHGTDEAARAFWDAVQRLAPGHLRAADVARPENQETALEELPMLPVGELPSVLPLEGWRTMTLHCQVDSIGTSDRHPDLSRLEVSFPPVTASAPEPPCPQCEGTRTIPVPSHQRPTGSVPCPDCSACTATAMHALAGRVQCGLAVGHYDEDQVPEDGPFSEEPGGWHQSAADRQGFRICWIDRWHGATPHRARPDTTDGTSRRD